MSASGWLWISLEAVCVCWQEDHDCMDVDHLSLSSASWSEVWEKKRLTTRTGG
ncbi:hypothetical protein E3U43_013782, partial [Larimichthys crocea]